MSSNNISDTTTITSGANTKNRNTISNNTNRNVSIPDTTNGLITNDDKDIFNTLESSVYMLLKKIPNYLGMFTMQPDGTTITLAGYDRETSEIQAMYILDILYDVQNTFIKNSISNTSSSCTIDTLRRLVGKFYISI